MPAAGRLVLCVILAALAALACGRTGSDAAPAPSAGAAAADRLAPLHAFEEERRKSADFAHLQPSDRAFGPDPIAVRRVPGASPPRWVGLLRGRDALVLLDDSLHELARAPTPALPTGLAIAADGEIAVSGEEAPSVALYAVRGDALHETERHSFDGRVHGLRDVALGGARGARVVYAVDELGGALLAYDGRHGTKRVSACVGPFRVARAGDELVVDCLLEHQLLVFDLDRDGLPVGAPRAVVRHDGPMWGFDARPVPDGLLLAAGGVEDHPLDRTQGSFGFIDSFVYLYSVPRAGEPRLLRAVNVSEHGVVTPKAITLRAAAGAGVTVLAAGYGSDRLAEIAWTADLTAPPTVTTRAIFPGAAGMAASDDDTLVFADPLFDAWFKLPPGPGQAATLVPLPDAPAAPARSRLSRVGEALFFTNLMAPWNHSTDRLSRFTCETCHFEGYVDGRTHHTGRGDVRATTKPLLGIFNNRPHFTRALDPNLTTMVDNEFRVAGAKSDHDAWFSALDTGLSWIGLLGVPPAELDAVTLRRALMTFFMDFTHRPNPNVLPARAFSESEKRGAGVFARRCESCHEARLSTDDPSTRQPPERWESLVMTREGPIVWAANVYKKTGIMPYVHDLGARPPSLRRLSKKWPYFTNGSAKSLRAVLERARFAGAEFWHDGAPGEAQGLAPEEVEALQAFLELL
jgi:hypothetical protein